MEGPRRLVYTDGACLRNPGPGGYCAILDGKIIAKGGEPDTTNNRMELCAAIEALAALPAGADIVIVSDSRYLIDGATKWTAGWVTNGWRTKAKGRPEVLNRDLWERLLEARDRHESVFWQWVRGHSGDRWNELADEVASREALTYADIPAWSTPRR